MTKLLMATFYLALLIGLVYLGIIIFQGMSSLIIVIWEWLKIIFEAALWIIIIAIAVFFFWLVSQKDKHRRLSQEIEDAKKEQAKAGIYRIPTRISKHQYKGLESHALVHIILNLTGSNLRYQDVSDLLNQYSDIRNDGNMADLYPALNKFHREVITLGKGYNNVFENEEEFFWENLKNNKIIIALTNRKLLEKPMLDVDRNSLLRNKIFICCGGKFNAQGTLLITGIFLNKGDVNIIKMTTGEIKKIMYSKIALVYKKEETPPDNT